MAKDKNGKKPKKQRWYKVIGEAYKITKRSYPWVGWALLGAAALGLLVGIVLTIVLGGFFWIVFGVMLAFILPMITLVRLVRRASYGQIDGMPGAVSAVLDNIGRGWNVTTEPVRFNARTQDLLFRAVGRAGIVLVTEGPTQRVRNLVAEEKRALKRVAPNTPIHVINVGNDDDQTKLMALEKEMRKFPKAITSQEVAALSNRLDALNSKALPIPKASTRQGPRQPPRSARKLTRADSPREADVPTSRANRGSRKKQTAKRQAWSVTPLEHDAAKLQTAG